MSQSRPSTLQHYLAWLGAFWRFSRPHTIIGTSLSVLGLYLIGLAGVTSFSLNHLDSLLGTLLACLCGNVYIVGLNQLEDVGIDQINKPHLPLASGEFSRVEGIVIVVVTGSLALLLAALQGAFLFATVGSSLLIGTAYSLPPIRLKRFALPAAICIFGVRGIIVNLGLFLHFKQGLGGASQVSPEVWALTVFVLGFTFAIALCKDIPDIEGDRRYQITTFTIHLGPQAVFNLVRWGLAACYMGIIIGSIWLPAVNRLFATATHLIAFGLMVWRSGQVDVKNKLSIASFYQFIWKLFFLEYLIFPTACLLG